MSVLYLLKLLCICAYGFLTRQINFTLLKCCLILSTLIMLGGLFSNKIGLDKSQYLCQMLFTFIQSIFFSTDHLSFVNKRSFAIGRCCPSIKPMLLLQLTFFDELIICVKRVDPQNGGLRIKR